MTLKRLATIAVIVLAISAAGVGVAARLVTSPPAPPLTGKIELVASISEHHSQGSHPTAMETWRYSLASVRRKGRPFGYAVMVCTRINSTNSLRQCEGSLSLPRGKIVVTGSLLYTEVFVLVVNGGTDAYRGVVGTVDVLRFTDSKTSFWMTVRLGT